MQTILFDSVHKVFRPGGFFFPTRRVETHALKGISFSVGKGEVLALLGPNGSGKSTTLKLLSTILLPNRGSVRIDGNETRARGQEVRRQVGFSVSHERSFFSRLTVRENLTFFAALDDVPRCERASRVDEVLWNVHLTEAANKQAMKLSSGMYQRLGIARALIKRPSVLLLDEPSRSLDVAQCADLWELVRQLSRGGTTVMLATHNLTEAIAVADRIGILQRGELLDLHAAAGLTIEALRSRYLRITGKKASYLWAEEVPA